MEHVYDRYRDSATASSRGLYDSFLGKTQQVEVDVWNILLLSSFYLSIMALLVALTAYILADNGNNQKLKEHKDNIRKVLLVTAAISAILGAVNFIVNIAIK